MSSTSSRFSRWSQRKAESRTAGKGIKFTTPTATSEDNDQQAIQDVERPLEDDRIETAEEDNGETPLADHENEESEELPDIESLNADSDFTPFMSDKVSDAVRNMALRKLWRSDSVFANLDGLLDYGEDFTDAATVVTGMQSAYKVGRGMVDYEAEAAKKAAEEQAAAEEETAPQTESEESPDLDPEEGESVDVSEDEQTLDKDQGEGALETSEKETSEAEDEVSVQVPDSTEQSV